MSILRFLQPQKEATNIDHYRKMINDFVKEEKLSLLEFTYMREYIDDITIVNASWLIDILNRIYNEHFNTICLDIFKSILKTDKNRRIIVDIDHLVTQMIDMKKNDIKFTCDQLTAIREAFEFLIDKNQKMYGLYGYAGTGKTTTLVEFVSHIIMEGLITSVIFSAPTNKAVTVMKSKFRRYLQSIYEKFSKRTIGDNFDYEEIIDKLIEHGIKIDFVTIHKLLKFKTDFNIEGDLIFVRNNGSIMDEYQLIIVDECSMIPLNVVDSIVEEVTRESGKSDNYKRVPKLIFAGDPAQLPAVNERTSAVFMTSDKMISVREYVRLMTNGDDPAKESFNIIREDELKGRYDRFVRELMNIKSITLKEVVRSKIDTVTKVCYATRQWVIGNTNMPNIKKFLNKGAYFYKYQNDDKLKTTWFNKCLKSFETGDGCNIIITWTNKQSDEYNDRIRQMIFKKDAERFEIGDILMINDFYNIDDGSNKPDKDDRSRFYTSEQIRVIGITKVIKQIEAFNFKLSDDGKRMKESKYIEKRSKPIIDKINKMTKRVYRCWRLNVSRVTEKIDQIEDTYDIYILDEIDRNILEADKAFSGSMIKKLRSMMQGICPKMKQIDKNVIKPLWREWHRLFIESFANVNYGYAISCHKGQGSNFYNVFVDAHDIFKNQRIDEMKRCLYTAMTRTSNELHVLI